MAISCDRVGRHGRTWRFKVFQGAGRRFRQLAQVAAQQATVGARTASPAVPWFLHGLAEATASRQQHVAAKPCGEVGAYALHAFGLVNEQERQVRTPLGFFQYRHFALAVAGHQVAQRPPPGAALIVAPS